MIAFATSGGIVVVVVVVIVVVLAVVVKESAPLTAQYEHTAFQLVYFASSGGLPNER